MAVTNLNVYGYKIDYCLSKTISLENRCSVRFKTSIMICMTRKTYSLECGCVADHINFFSGVCVANLARCGCICYTMLLYRAIVNVPLSTLGDAAISFLVEPDPTTLDMSLATRNNIDELWKRNKSLPWVSVEHRWCAVGSWKHWLVTITL